MFLRQADIRCHQEPWPSGIAYPANVLKTPEKDKQTQQQQKKRHIEALQVYKGMMKKEGNV